MSETARAIVARHVHVTDTRSSSTAASNSLLAEKRRKVTEQPVFWSHNATVVVPTESGKCRRTDTPAIVLGVFVPPFVIR
jgi:hypothetical protein